MHRVRSDRLLLLLLLVTFQGWRGITLAQQTINYAAISGRVTDPTDAVIASAQVTSREIETNLTSTTTTDSEGRFRFPYLKPGPYEISVRAPGFADVKRSVTLTVGAAFELPISLKVAAVETDVEVGTDQEL